MITPKEGRRRVVIEAISPEVDGGRFPVKRTIGDRVRVEADIFVDGHDSISALVLYRPDGSEFWIQEPMQPLGNDRWSAEFTVTELGRYRYTIQAWIDHYETWRKDLLKRIAAKGDTAVDYLIGAQLIEDAASRAVEPDASFLGEQVSIMRSEEDLTRKRESATSHALNEAMVKYPNRRYSTDADREIVLVVDPLRARFSAWYEFFPRSTSGVEGQHGTFADCEARLQYAADMGFDVVYFPPIHPIGVNFRKGPNNLPASDPGDVGSPWAIGSAEGGFKSVHAELGTLEDFRRLLRRASELGIQIALDIAFQASPDHPYVKDHEDWFRKRPDGTIQYAENPPKKYQDIYPFDFETPQWFELWRELKSVFRYWIEQGVRIFRVDNPHTKTFPFWEWVITEIKGEFPAVLFLSEAFTRPKVMYRLGKLGFSQSYTYFPWRTVKHEITSYLSELTQTGVRDFFRPNHWPNTPDILPEFLQTGMRSSFLIRFLLAATLGANYGIYGPAFELLESRPVRPGSEEYIDSEKYQLREWDVENSRNLRDLITQVNRIRRENPALQLDWTLQFHHIDSDQLICYSKQSVDEANLIIVLINLDPHHAHSGFVTLPLDQLKIDGNQPYQVHDLLTDAKYFWHGERNYVELHPDRMPAHIFCLRRSAHTEADFDYFL